jgi:hypothetical protein
MARRTGSADLPLHRGRVPQWLAERMAVLGAVITQAIVHHYGRDEFLERLSHPFWFQSFGAVMGMDWHSSGITTSVIGALKRGLVPLQQELGIHVCGGRGRHSRRTPDELMLLGERTGFDAGALTRASRLVAKVDSAAVQDGFDLYLHGFFVTTTASGPWSSRVWMATSGKPVDTTGTQRPCAASSTSRIALSTAPTGARSSTSLTDGPSAPAPRKWSCSRT